MENPDSANSRLNHPPIHSAQAWEETLAEMNARAEQNFELFTNLQRSHQPVPPAPLNVVPNPLSRSQLNSTNPTRTAPPRAQSAPRNASRADPHVSTSKDFNSNLVISPSSEMERKIDFLMKRTRQLEDKIKRNEKGNVTNNETTSLSCAAMEQLLDAQKTDKKLILSLRENMIALKNQMEQLQFRDDVRDKASSRPPGSNPLQTFDIDSVKEVIVMRVQKDMDQVIQEVARSCAIEQASYLSTWAEREKQEREKAYLGGLNAVNAVSVLQSELAKINSEMMRLKGRQDALEGTLIELRDISSTKEADYDKQHKKAISSYRTEFQIVVDSIGRNVNEQLESLSSVNSERVNRIEHEIHRQENEIIRLQANQQVVEDSFSELRQAVDMSIPSMQATLSQCEERCTYALNVASRAESDCRRSAECADNVMKMIAANAAQAPIVSSAPSSSILLVESKVNAAFDSIHSLQSTVDRLTNATLSATSSLESKMDKLSASVDSDRQQRHQELSQIEERSKRMKSKIRELMSTMSSVSTVRERVDSLLTELTESKAADANKLQQVLSSNEKNKSSIKEVSSLVNHVKDELSAKIVDLDARLAAQGPPKLNQVEINKLKQSVASHEIAIDDLRKSINSLSSTADGGAAKSPTIKAQRLLGSADKSKFTSNQAQLIDTKSFDDDNNDEFADGDGVNSVHSSHSSGSDGIYDFVDKHDETHDLMTSPLPLEHLIQKAPSPQRQQQSISATFRENLNARRSDLKASTTTNRGDWATVSKDTTLPASGSSSRYKLLELPQSPIMKTSAPATTATSANGNGWGRDSSSNALLDVRNRSLEKPAKSLSGPVEINSFDDDDDNKDQERNEYYRVDLSRNRSTPNKRQSSFHEKPVGLSSSFHDPEDQSSPVEMY